MRKILIVIDMQNDFIDGPLGSLEAEKIIDKVVQVIYKYPLENIIATRDTHGEDYLNTQEGKRLPIPHCIKGTLGWNLHPRITAALNGATIMGKSTFASGGYHRRPLHGYLRCLQCSALKGVPPRNPHPGDCLRLCRL